jgi:hypothetical protein
VSAPAQAAATVPRTEAEARRTATLAANIVGVPLALQAFALGLGSDVATWWAPWSLAAALPFLFGARPGRIGALVIACVAMVAGPAPFAGTAAGALAADIATRGARPRFVLPAALCCALVTTSLLAVSLA